MAISINLKRAKEMLMRKSLYHFLVEFWDTWDTAPYKDNWLVEWQCECFMYSVKHFLPYYITNDWIDDKTYGGIKKEANAICDVRDKLFQGAHVRNHDWNMPPRHMKSSIMNVAGPTWLVTNVPVSVASVSHTAGLSGDMNSNRLKAVQSEKYRYYFSGNNAGLQLRKASSSNVQLNNGAELYSVCQTSFTGFGADVILADDLISADNAAKDKQVLKNALTFFTNTLPTRLNSKSTGVIWHIQQRLAPGDISGTILGDSKLSQVYSHTELQAISDRDINFIYPCTGKVKEIHKGDLLWEERFGDYTEIRFSMGESNFQTQYQQNARASDNAIVKEEYIHYIEDNEVEPFKVTAEMHYASHDCPVKDAEINDYHGFAEGYGRGNELVITDGWEEHLGYVKEKQLLQTLNNIDPAIGQIIEDKANGAALLQDLKDDVPGLITFDPGTNSKAQRLGLASVYMQSGAVRFVKNDNTQKLIAELLKFPFLVHDDGVDAFSQLVLYHFTQRKAGVYTNCFTYQNIIPTAEKTPPINQCIFGATLNGQTIKIIQVRMDKEKFIVCNEWQVMGLQKFEEFYIDKLHGNPVFIDASYENSLYNILGNPRIVLRKFNDKDRDKSIQLMKVGFYKKKILVEKHCMQTANDISKLRIVQTAAQLKKGTEVIETIDEGFAGCLRGIITTQKGLSGTWY